MQVPADQEVPMLIPHGTLVLVLDGRHLRLLRNRGRDTAPDLELVPEKAFGGVGGSHGDHEEARVRTLVAAIAPMLAGGTPIILVAPPHLLGTLRSELPAPLRRQVIAEIARDLTGCAPDALAHRLQLTPA
jgi:protein required for attachment to host cells